MILHPQFNDKELEDIQEGLKIGSIHTVAVGETERWFLISEKIRVMREMNRGMK